MTRVSVIMACHNAAPFVSRAVESVRNQTFMDLELIIVDDASRDDSLLHARKAAHGDSRVVVHSLAENVGAGAARNMAIAGARGEWLAILDADDVFLAEKLERQSRLCDKAGSDVVLIGTDSYAIDGAGNRLSLQRYPCNSRNLIQNLVRHRRFPPHSSLMYRTDVVRSLGCFNVRFPRSQDYDLWLRLSRHGSFASVPEPLVEYRRHESNISNTNAGCDQLKYGFAATTCHFIRARGHQDLSRCSSVHDWELFLAWIARRLAEEGVPRYRQTTEEWRGILSQGGSLSGRTIRLALGAVMNPRFAWQVSKERLFGTRLPEQLADEWIRSPASRPSDAVERS